MELYKMIDPSTKKRLELLNGPWFSYCYDFACEISRMRLLAISLYTILTGEILSEKNKEW